MKSILAGDYTIYLLLLAIIISYVFIFIFALNNRKLHKKYLKLLKGVDAPNLEQVILHIQNEQEKIFDKLADQQTSIEQIIGRIKRMKGNISIHRYSAFSEDMSGLSYSVVLLDDSHDGVVITGLYYREQSYTYAKSIENGESKHKLSPEEREAIAKSIKNHDSLE